MKSTAGLIFSNIHDRNVPELTKLRTMASIPFAGRYRLVDFALSNFVNSDITNVGIITHHNYQSLMDHIGNGKDWDLSRRSGGIQLIPPYVTTYENYASGKLYENRLEALLGASTFINRCNADYIILTDCDTVCNIDLSAVRDAHIQSGADVTVVTRTIDAELASPDRDVYVMETDRRGNIKDILMESPKKGKVQVSTNILVFTRTALQMMLGEALAHGQKYFYTEMLRMAIGHYKMSVYRFDGFFRQITSLESYFRNSMDILDRRVIHELFGVDSGRLILTKIRNSAPTKYMGESRVTGSIVADGCVIEGTVENSILFRGVTVGRGAVVKNCILMQDTIVADNTSLNCVITDKDAVIGENRILSGCEVQPYFVGKRVRI